MKKELGISVLLVVLCVAVALLNPDFLKAENIQNMLRLVGIFGIFSIGLGLVIITGGIDVGAKAEVYRLLRELGDRGVSVIMISSDMEEVLRVSDRVAVMHEGSLAGILSRDQCNEETIMNLAVGKHPGHLAA